MIASLDTNKNTLELENRERERETHTHTHTTSNHKRGVRKLGKELPGEHHHQV
jgi:hypothetical protein